MLEFFSQEALQLVLGRVGPLGVVVIGAVLIVVGVNDQGGGSVHVQVVRSINGIMHRFTDWSRIACLQDLVLIQRRRSTIDGAASHTVIFVSVIGNEFPTLMAKLVFDLVPKFNVPS